jgi:ketosteroid isomerase-like protein
MAQENVEVVRRVYDAWNAGDMTALRDLCDPDAWTGDTLEPVTDFIAAADRVVVRDAWRGSGQGPDADMEFTRVFTLRESKIIEIEIFWDHTEALEATRLSE